MSGALRLLQAWLPHQLHRDPLPQRSLLFSIPISCTVIRCPRSPQITVAPASLLQSPCFSCSSFSALIRHPITLETHPATSAAAFSSATAAAGYKMGSGTVCEELMGMEKRRERCLGADGGCLRSDAGAALAAALVLLWLRVLPLAASGRCSGCSGCFGSVCSRWALLWLLWLCVLPLCAGLAYYTLYMELLSRCNRPTNTEAHLPRYSCSWTQAGCLLFLVSVATQR